MVLASREPERTKVTIDRVSISARRFRLAVLNAHPIIYFVPIYRCLAQHPDVDLTVYYCSRLGIEKFFDPLFGVQRSFGTSVLDGYRYRFLSNIRKGNIISGYTSCINFGIVSEIWRERYDALWVHSYNYITYLLALTTARLRGTSIFYRAEHSLTYDSKVRRSFWVRIFKPLFLRLLFKQVECFLSIGSRNTEFYLYYGVQPHQIFHVPYVADNEYFSRRVAEFRLQRDEMRAAMGISREDVVFLFAAKMIPKKAPLELLQAYERVSQPGKALIMVGDGELRAEAEAYVAREKMRGVHFLGYLDHQELSKIYAISDVFVRPDGLYIGDWGNTVNEAMASGLAIIATDCIAASVDLVKDGENGFVVRFGDLDDLAAAMRRMVINPTMCRQMGKRSSEIISTWTYEQCVEGILQALHSLDSSEGQS